MNSRTIVTSHPDIACDVCERRLLRGEQHETFLVAGHPRTICELCAPRAAHQGWKRVSDLDAATVAVARPRRARSILDRFRAASRGHWMEPETGAGDTVVPRGAGEGDRKRHLDDGRALAAGVGDLAGEASEAFGEVDAGIAAPGPLARALEIFNATEYPRRIGGVARSLGAPEVSVRELDVSGVVSIVVAWELCWYRYRVDIDNSGDGAELVAQGTELAELERAERDVNAAADDRGAVHLHASA